MGRVWVGRNKKSLFYKSFLFCTKRIRKKEMFYMSPHPTLSIKRGLRARFITIYY